MDALQISEKMLAYFNTIKPAFEEYAELYDKGGLTPSRNSISRQVTDLIKKNSTECAQHLKSSGVAYSEDAFTLFSSKIYDMFKGRTLHGDSPKYALAKHAMNQYGWGYYNVYSKIIIAAISLVGMNAFFSTTKPKQDNI